MTITAPRTTPSGSQAGSSGEIRAEIRALTGLRIVAAAWVVLFHFHFTPLSGVAEVVGVLGPLITSGALGVDLFFVLSGFVIAHTYLATMGPDLRARVAARYLWARICRMWPLYALVFHLFGLWLLARLVLGSDTDIAFQGVQPVVSVGQWVQQLFMMQMWNNEFLDGASWVGPTWSISAEWLAYLLFPAAALVFHRMRNLPLPVLAGTAVALMVPIAVAWVTLGHPYFPWSWAVRILCGFAAGVLAHLVVRRMPRTPAVRRGASRLAAGLPVLIAAVLWGGGFVGTGAGGVVIVAFPVLVGALALADRGPATLLARPALVQGGRVSYALYLVHIPMFELFWLAQAYVPALRGGFVGHLVGATVVVLTYPVAAAAFRWVEEPARRRLKAMVPNSAGPSGAVVPPTSADGSGGTAGAGGALPAPTPPDRPGVLPALPAPRHAVGPNRQSTLAGLLVNAAPRPAAHRASSANAAGLDATAALRRSDRVRSISLHAGS